MRKHGYANVEEHPKGSGLFRVRARIGQRLVTVASKLNVKQANAAADTYGQLRDDGAVREGITLTQFGDSFFGRRERRVRNASKDRNRWKNHIDGDSIGAIALRALRRSDVVEWRDRLEDRDLARQSRKNSLNLLRVALAEALDRELVDENVARDVTIPRGEGTEKEDLEGVLEPAEQVKLLEAVPEAMRPMVEVALFTGLRWSELSWLKREDIKSDEIIVRRSTGGGPTKSGKPRRVPLLPPARAALDAQLAAVQKSSQWVFPSEDGVPRQNRPNAWPEWVKAAKLGRHIRWHDLRHTCATALLAGWWGGERWTLDEVCGMLGHANVSTTERYARKLDDTVRNAAKKKFPGGNGPGGNGANRFAQHLLPKPKVARSIRAGGAQENRLVAIRAVLGLGTFRELPRPLKKALARTSVRTREGIVARHLAVAYAATVDGDGARTERSLRRLLKAGGWK